MKKNQKYIRMWAWGSGSSGQLGLGDKFSRKKPTLITGGIEGEGESVFGRSVVVMAACGSEHTLAATQDGGLWAWGSTAWGRLGLGPSTIHSSATLLEGAATAGGTTAHDEKSYGEDVLVPTRVQVECGHIVSVAAGDAHSVALCCDGTLLSFGMATLEMDAHSSDDSDASDIALPLIIPTGLGHADGQHKFVPTPIVFMLPPMTEPLHAHECGALERIGRWRALPLAHVLAFAMATHQRLGLASAFGGILTELLQCVVEAGRVSPAGRVANQFGVVAVLGGGGCR